MNLRAAHLVILGALLIGLAVSVGFNLYPLFQSPTIIGVADSKQIGHGVDERGEVTWYTVSLRLVTEDKENHVPVSGTLAYIVEKEDFDRIHDGAVVKGKLRGRLGLRVLELTHAETFASGNEQFFREQGTLTDQLQGAQIVTFDQLFSSPDRYNGREILVEGFYFHGWEIIVLSERLEYSGPDEGHLWPRGQMVWIEGDLIPPGVYGRLYQYEGVGPVERFGKLRIEGRFEYGGRYGHLGGFNAQIAPSEVELLPWSPLPTGIAIGE